MAGIGFELKGLFQRKGVFARMRAYGYAGVICAGPMLLGVLLLVGIMVLCGMTGALREDRELLICMITYTLLASLLVTSFFSMVVTRFLADMFYEEKLEYVLASFWGSNGVMLVVGCILYGVFLMFSGVSLLKCFFAFTLFGESIVVWNAMSYLTAIKDYKGMLKAFVSAVIVTFGIGYVLLYLGIPHVEALLAAACTGYGLMMVWDIILLYRYFPQAKVSAFCFLHWFDQFFLLALTGLFLNIGMFAHLIIMWAGPIGVQVEGLFYGAPFYDVSALLAFLTTLVTTVNFVVSVEVNFYPKYRTYYGLFNDRGSVKDIQQAENEMLTVLGSELKYAALKQLIASALAVSVFVILIRYLPLGFNDMMLGYFRILCVGYGMYAIGNTILLLLLYFTDYKGAMISALVFAGSTILFTVISLFFNEVYFGFGFLLGCALFFGIAYLRLDSFTRQLPYYILSVQPIVSEEKSGIFTKIGVFLQRREKFLNEK